MKGFQFIFACLLINYSVGHKLEVDHSHSGGEHHGDHHGSHTVDLHKDKFCTDISGYGPLYYKDQDEKCCTTSYMPVCEQKWKKFCLDVTNIVCKPFATPNCTVSTELRPGTRARITTATVDIKECKTRTVNIPHIKEVPVCKNVTKHNCETNWEVVNGQKIWAGNEKCTPVTWQECKLEEVKVDFPTQVVDCEDAKPEPYPTCSPANKVDIKVPVTNCQFITGTKCEPEVRRECVEIEYTECGTMKVDDCDDSKVRKPAQDFIHKKKCLLASDMEKLAAVHKHK
jgi:hypothetical protein